MKEQAVREMLSLFPERVGLFEGTEFPLPIKTAYLADKILDISAIKSALLEKQAGDVKYLLDPLLLGAEAIESVQEDRGRFFITDRKVQNYVFMGSKWRAGWALVLGGKDNAELLKGLKEREFMIFTDEPDIPDTAYIGNRSTSPIYFLQMMVRYGLVWGRIKPGDDHQLGHFLETDMPGLLIIREGLDPLKYLITLGLMKLGAPAIVPSSFPFPYGNRVVADKVQDILTRINGFQNLRRKFFNGEVITLPDGANPAYANQDFPAATSLGGAVPSFFCVRPGKGTLPDEPAAKNPSPGGNIGILVEINEPHFSDDIASVVEKAALRSINFLDGYRASMVDGTLKIEFAQGITFDWPKVKDVLCLGIRLQYPGIKNISVICSRDPAVLDPLYPEVTAYQDKRTAMMNNMTEENTGEFCVCTECRPFSLVHTCILTPDRTPMCAARTYFTTKAAHYFGWDVTPYQRQSEKELPLRFAFKKGKTLDAMRGEYEGANEAYRKMTGGALSRVYLHSLKDVPHTSCGCFQNLAFFLGDTDYIGIMKRGSATKTPDGRTWEMLANYAGGKQSPGIMGVSTQYLQSVHFLRGDGGMAKVAWTDSELFPKIKNRLLPGQRVATEKEVKSMEELKAFQSRKG